MMAIYVRSLLATTQMLNEKQITWAFSTEYSSMVSDAREMTLNGDSRNEIKNTKPFKGNVTYDKILWIDSDIAWSPEDVLKLYESDKDIVSGAYLLASGEVTAYKKLLGPGYTFEEVLKMKDLEKVDGTGFGFLCVKQGVFESLSRPWFQSSWITMKDEETKEEFSFPIMGEDLSWCKRAREAGFEIWLDPTVKVIHHKTVKLTWEGMKP
jgi:GT2 family glycosyltransferase